MGIAKYKILRKLQKNLFSREFPLMERRYKIFGNQKKLAKPYVEVNDVLAWILLRIWMKK
jgi:hypothetical protein